MFAREGNANLSFESLGCQECFIGNLIYSLSWIFLVGYSSISIALNTCTHAKTTSMKMLLEAVDGVEEETRRNRQRSQEAIWVST